MSDQIGVVIDVGSAYTKAGFATESCPRSYFPTVVGRFRRVGLLDGFPDIYCGDEAILKRGVSNLTWPVEEGLMKHWDEMEKLWFHIFYKELLVPPEQTNVVHAVHPLIPNRDKEKIAEILFENLSIRGLYLAKSPALSLHALGKTTGIVYEAGASTSYACPVFEGFPLQHATITSPITGAALTNVLTKMLADKGYTFTTAVERDLVEKLKCQHCRVCKNFDEEINAKIYSDSEIKYKLPDGQEIYLDKEKFKCPEALFQPKLFGFDSPNIIDVTVNSIDKCDMDVRADMYKNIVLSGGTSMLSGFSERFALELGWRVKNIPDFQVNVEGVDRREIAAWSGGSILASLSLLKGCLLTSQEYNDIGVDRVHHKFF